MILSSACQLWRTDHPGPCRKAPRPDLSYTTPRDTIALISSARIDPTIQRRAKWRNFVNTWLIVTGLVALLTLSAWLLLGTTGVIWALVLGAFMLITGPRFSPTIIPRLYKARPLDPEHVPDLWRIVHELARRAKDDARLDTFWRSRTISILEKDCSIGATAFALSEARRVSARQINGC